MPPKGCGDLLARPDAGLFRLRAPLPSMVPSSGACGTGVPSESAHAILHSEAKSRTNAGGRGEATEPRCEGVGDGDRVIGSCFSRRHADAASGRATPRREPRPIGSGRAPGSKWSIGRTGGGCQGERRGDVDRARVGAGQAPKPTAARALGRDAGPRNPPSGFQGCRDVEVLRRPRPKGGTVAGSQEGVASRDHRTTNAASPPRMMRRRAGGTCAARRAPQRWAAREVERPLRCSGFPDMAPVPRPRSVATRSARKTLSKGW